MWFFMNVRIPQDMVSHDYTSMSIMVMTNTSLILVMIIRVLDDQHCDGRPRAQLRGGTEFHAPRLPTYA